MGKSKKSKSNRSEAQILRQKIIYADRIRLTPDKILKEHNIRQSSIDKIKNDMDYVLSNREYKTYRKFSPYIMQSAERHTLEIKKPGVEIETVRFISAKNSIVEIRAKLRGKGIENEEAFNKWNDGQPIQEISSRKCPTIENAVSEFLNELEIKREYYKETYDINLNKAKPYVIVSNPFNMGKVLFR